MVTHFQSMLTRLGFNALSAYYSKVVYRADADVSGAPRFMSLMKNFFTARSAEPPAALCMKMPKQMPHGEPSPPSANFLKINCRTLLSATTRVALWALSR
jgi:hypothetical protein